MGRPELKHLITGIDHLPATMKVVARALSTLFDSNPDMDLAGALVAMDPAFASSVLRMAHTSTGRTPPQTASIQDAVRAAGLDGLRRAALGVALTSLPLQSYQSCLERHLRHALACAACAAQAASHIRLMAPDEAYIAGLLHDVGRLALLAAMPEDYCAFLESHDEGAVDRVERDEFGVDHALVGKWLAERWALPRPLSQSIWFHHLPSGTLLGNRPIVQLVEVVSLANAMSYWILGDHSRASGHAGEAVHAHADRLGMNSSDIELLREQTCEALDQRLALLEATSGGDLATAQEIQETEPDNPMPRAPENLDTSSLKQELRWLDALNRLNTSLRPSHTLTEVIGLIAAAVREGLDAAPGMCCAFDEGKRSLVGMTWDTADAAPESFRIPLSPSSQEDLDEVEILALEALDQLGIGMGPNGWRGAGKTEPELRDGILMLPMVADGVTHGQIMFETDAESVEQHSLDGVKLMAFAGACGAVLARHHAYNELEELSEELAEAIARNAGKDGAAATADLAEFAIGTSQVLQHPLNFIANHAHLLLRRAHGPEEVNAAEAILEQNRKLGKLVNDLMAFARPGAAAFTPTMVNYVLHRLLSTLADRLAAKGITVVEEYEEGLPRVLADKQQLEHALLNLVINAEQAMEKTGGRLTVKTAASADRKSVCIVVQDTGPGIPAKRAEAIFEPFVTLGDVRTGTGLGLAVCRSVVHKHRGALRLVRTEEAETAFEIILPVDLEKAAPPVGAAPVIGIGRAEGMALREGVPDKPPASPPEPKRVERAVRPVRAPKPAPVLETPFEEPEPAPMPSLLLIDENETTREVLKETLRNRGFSVVAAQDAVRAMQAVAATLFDAVLLDFELRDVDGPNLLTELHNIRPGLPVIVMTADSQPEKARTALDRGARACLSKPFALQELLAEVEDAVGIHNN